MCALIQLKGNSNYRSFMNLPVVLFIVVPNILICVLAIGEGHFKTAEAVPPLQGDMLKSENLLDTCVPQNDVRTQDLNILTVRTKRNIELVNFETSQNLFLWQA